MRERPLTSRNHCKAIELFSHLLPSIDGSIQEGEAPSQSPEEVLAVGDELARAVVDTRVAALS